MTSKRHPRNWFASRKSQTVNGSQQAQLNALQAKFDALLQRGGLAMLSFAYARDVLAEALDVVFLEPVVNATGHEVELASDLITVTLLPFEWRISVVGRGRAYVALFETPRMLLDEDQLRTVRGALVELKALDAEHPVVHVASLTGITADAASAS